MVALIYSQPAMAARLAEQHRDDGTGHCRSCSSGAQTGRYTHPCYILLAAEEATRLRKTDRRATPAPDPAVTV